MESPCTKVCTIDPATAWCLGCGRTLDEIAEWASAGEARQRRIVEQLPARLAQLKQR